MKIKIGNKQYEIEYSFEAAKYDDCVTKLYGVITDAVDGQVKNDGAKALMSIAGKPSLVITLFYAGLMEHNPVEDESEAANLLKQYIKENKGKADANFYGIFKLLNKQMETDGFLDLIGLTSLIAEVTAKAEEGPSSKIKSDSLN